MHTPDILLLIGYTILFMGYATVVVGHILQLWV